MASQRLPRGRRLHRESGTPCNTRGVIPDIRLTSAAQSFFDTHCGPGVLELFMQQHLASLPLLLRGEKESRFRDRHGTVYAVVTTWCERGRLKSLIRSAREAGL